MFSLSSEVHHRLRRSLARCVEPLRSINQIIGKLFLLLLWHLRIDSFQASAQSEAVSRHESLELRVARYSGRQSVYQNAW